MTLPTDIIPGSHAEVRWWNWLLWALWGNDDDGVCGEKSFVPTYGHWLPPEQRVSWKQFLRWQWRNPLHNLLWVVLAWPGGPLLKWGKRPGWNGYIGFRPPRGAFGIALKYERN